MLGHSAHICCFCGSPHSMSLFWIRLSPVDITALCWPLPWSPGLDFLSRFHSESKFPINHPLCSMLFNLFRKDKCGPSSFRSPNLQRLMFRQNHYLSQWKRHCLPEETREDKRLCYTTAIWNLTPSPYSMVWMNRRPKQKLGGGEKETASQRPMLFPLCVCNQISVASILLVPMAII